MGLGPPVCVECEVIMVLPNYQPPWKCPVCGASGTHKNLWELSQDTQDRIERNSNLLRLCPYEEIRG
jgi:PHP family Zn ribbon phosphoesterase